MTWGMEVMALTMLTGLIVGVLLFLWAMSRGGSASDFISPAALAVVVGGTLASTLMHYPVHRLMAAIKAVNRAVFSPEEDLESLRSLLVQHAERARREGLLALEEEAEGASDLFLRKGLGLVVDGIDPELVRSILENDLALLEERNRQEAAIFESMAQYAPAFGLAGTLVGLVQMLRSLSDPSRIGPGLAVALLTTLYGALLANLLFTPIAGKLKVRSREELLSKELMLEGISAIGAGDGPALITQRLSAFLVPGPTAAAETWLGHRVSGMPSLEEE